MTALRTPTATRYATQTIGDVEVFYRTAGSPENPTVLLLHGFPTSSHMFRDLIPRLAADYHIVAPDLPGFGSTNAPPRGDYDYSFDGIAKTILDFTDATGLEKYAIYVFDYGAPIGFRLATARPDRVTAVISQNGNAYEEGLTPAWGPIQAYWNEDNAENRDALRALLTPETTWWQYSEGVPEDRLRFVSPDGPTHDQQILDSPGNDEIQLDLFRDYAKNVALYPKWQAYLRENRPPLLAVWGQNDPYFGPDGARAFERDLPDAEIVLLDTGHFALETHGVEIADRIRTFLAKNILR